MSALTRSGDRLGASRVGGAARRRWPGAALAALAGLLLAGCAVEHAQSALHPASAESRTIARVWWVLLGVYGAVTLITFGLLAAALISKRRDSGEGAGVGGPPGGGIRFVVVAGIVAPVLILLVLLVYTLGVSAALSRPPEAAFTVQVIGHQWWWEVRYPEQGVVTANEIHLPVGEVVHLELSSADVVHSFWVPNLHGKMDALPDHRNAFWLRADQPGVYRGQCAEFCGLQHALMALEVVAMPPEAFARWVADRQRPRPAPSDSELLRGRAVFFQAGCHACHAVRGTPAVATVGPDLTHVGVRRTLGAGTVANSRGALAGWIADPQGVKPGNLMPPTLLEPGELHDLVRWLEELR